MKPGRNDPCPCGSGRKYKHCCEAKQSGAVLPAAELNQLGMLVNAGQFAVVEARTAALLERYPDEAGLWKLFAISLQMLGKNGLAAFQQAATLSPGDAGAHMNLGNALQDAGRLDEAVRSYQRALAIKPTFAMAYNNLGLCFHALGQPISAIENYRKALLLDPKFAEAYNNLGFVQIDLGQLGDAQGNFRHALEIDPDNFEASSNLLLSLNYSANLNPQDYLSIALRFGKIAAQNATPRYTAWGCETQPRRLRVGIVSGDLGHHPVGYFTENLLARLDPAQIELIAYPTQPNEDDLTARIKPYFSAWKPVFALSDQAAAQLIHADGVHVLLDLSGHTAKNRLPMFAWKPAPVQVSWLGLPTTTGIAEMDYVLGDPVATPPEDAGHFSEQIWRLPETYICLSRPDAALAVRALPALSNGFITFGSLNNLAKVNDATVSLWARILASVPHSRLLLKAHQLRDPMAVTTTLQCFAAQGIEAERLILVQPTSQRSDHLASYHRVDIGLDPFPYPGVTTSAEALWMGVPVLCMQGDRFLSRTAASIAHNAGLPDWIATSEDDYVAKAIQFSRDVPRLAALRAALREQVRVSPLFDAPRFTKHFEQALWKMWQNRQEQYGTTE